MLLQIRIVLFTLAVGACTLTNSVNMNATPQLPTVAAASLRSRTATDAQESKENAKQINKYVKKYAGYHSLMDRGAWYFVQEGSYKCGADDDDDLVLSEITIRTEAHPQGSGSTGPIRTVTHTFDPDDIAAYNNVEDESQVIKHVAGETGYPIDYTSGDIHAHIARDVWSVSIRTKESRPNAIKYEVHDDPNGGGVLSSSHDQPDILFESKDNAIGFKKLINSVIDKKKSQRIACRDSDGSLTCRAAR
jgi:hypothetical protein